MIDFLKTPAGKRFFERDIPNITKAVNRVATALEKHEGVSLQNLMQGYLAKMRGQGVTIDPKAVAKLKLEKGSADDQAASNPLGLKPIKLDESDITSAPADSKRRALYLALDNWIQTCPDERALVVEHLRGLGDVSAQKAATILILFVQFEDTVREALLEKSSCEEP